MATINITVPPAYVEDMRRALVRELVNDADALKTDSAAIDNGDRHEYGARSDFASASRNMVQDLGLLGQLAQSDAAGATITRENDLDGAITHSLESFVRVVADRLEYECGFGPIGAGNVLDIAGRLRWAGELLYRSPDEEETVTIDRVTRNALLAHVSSALENPAQEMDGADLEHNPGDGSVRVLRDLLDRFIPVLDALAPDADEFELPVVAGLAAWLRDTAVPGACAVAADCRDGCFGLDRDELDAGMTKEEARAAHVERAEQAQEALAALLERLDGAMAVA